MKVKQTSRDDLSLRLNDGKKSAAFLVVDFFFKHANTRLEQECVEFSLQVQSGDERRAVGSTRAGQHATPGGWSSASPSCSPAAGCGTPGRRPGPSRPD